MTGTWNISSWIESGEIVNTCVNQVHGWVRLSGVDRPIYLNLTGNMSTDLAGRRISFDAMPAKMVSIQAKRLSRQQVGPTGVMTRCSVLVLEWHSQDGRVFAELSPSRIRVSERSDEFDEIAIRDNTLLAHAMPARGDAMDCWQERGVFCQMTSLASIPTRPKAKSMEDQFALLDAMLDEKAVELPVRELLGDRIQLPQAASLSGELLQLKVKEVLAHLAALGVTLDMCHHFTPDKAYKMLLDVLSNERIHPESCRSGFIVHYMTFEHCEQCLEEERASVELASDHSPL